MNIKQYGYHHINGVIHLGISKTTQHIARQMLAEGLPIALMFGYKQK
ncbi:hypothetical protein [Beggiatoa leptomitoformis]|uniref:Uncharacterized protein n=1 Tax=Beggiatoa leptomitoformis TaxID=288004 RepID=A0A650GDA1_9GAMM|nr:hypothetical protein [Beggiatoa leptomitoformis]QGX03779.1 hypothetical protein AL038_19310 [Beggiatoa leptomitoformis]QGX04123.1 hypothetical protein BLE401_18710 [Beggiatoa leptomitoformis]